MLTIGSNGSLALDGTHVSLPMEEMRGFLLANISEPCYLDGASLRDLMNVLFHVQDFIRSYFLEEYHAVNASISTMKPLNKIASIQFYKEIMVDGDSFLSIVPKVNIVMWDEGSDSLADVCPELVDQLSVSEKSLALQELKLWTNFTLLEVMDCVCSELSYALSETPGDWR